MRIQTLTGALFALAAVTLTLYVAHQIGKYPEEPSWTYPHFMFDNLAFVIALGLGLPWPKVFAAILLIFAGWSGYILGARMFTFYRTRF